MLQKYARIVVTSDRQVNIESVDGTITLTPTEAVQVMEDLKLGMVSIRKGDTVMNFTEAAAANLAVGLVSAITWAVDPDELRKMMFYPRVVEYIQ